MTRISHLDQMLSYDVNALWDEPVSQTSEPEPTGVLVMDTRDEEGEE